MIPRTAILYQSESCDVTLIDIPTSIALAQGKDSTDVILSTPPLDEPYLIENEPRAPKANTKQEKHSYYSSNPLHAEYKATIEPALSKIRDHLLGQPWCLPRKLMTHVPSSRNIDMDIDDPEKDINARLREWSASKGKEETFDFEKMMASLGSGSDATSTGNVTHPWLMSYSAAREVPAGSQSDEPGSPEEPWMSSFYNSHDHAIHLTVSGNIPPPGTGPHYRFKIPPRSSLFLSDSTQSHSFRASFRELTEEYTLPRHFDFILLDPPWPSGSAKRKGNYEQVGGMPHMKKHLQKMDIDNYIEHNGLVGIWITNKESIREIVLGPGGLFERWNVGLIEEWIWIKTTTKGEPMFSIDSEWRKPYETLLLGRAAPNAWTTMAPAPMIQRRIIAAVPDLHSRKPCLKDLIEPYMSDANDYSALEIFSRYLVAGWTSWGNEVLKFNWDQYWASSSVQ